MSIDCAVVFDIRKIISSSDWAALVKPYDIELSFDPNFHLIHLSGFLPCKINGFDSGFEVYFDDFDPEENFSEKARRLAGRRQHEMAFSVHGSNLDILCMTVAATLFCEKVDGLMLYGNELPYVGRQEAMSELESLMKKLF